MLLRLKTAASSPLLTTAELKSHMRVFNSTEDAIVAGFGRAAEQWVSRRLSRSLVTETWLQLFPAFPSAGVLRLSRPPLREVVAVTYIDIDGVEQTLSTDQYVVVKDDLEARIERARGATWPATATMSAAVTVEFTAGYGNPSDVPEPIRHACLLMAAHLYDNRAATSDKALSMNPIAVDALIDPYRTHGWI